MDIRSANKQMQRRLGLSAWVVAALVLLLFQAGVWAESSVEEGLVSNPAKGYVTQQAGIDIEKVATPVFDPTGGTYTTAQTVRISSNTSGADIRYTVNGSTPTCSSGNSLSNGGTLNVDESLTLKAIGCRSGFEDSALAGAAYEIGIQPTAASELVNLSTRGGIHEGEGAMVGGFVIQGSGPKRVLIKGIGPSLSAAGLTGVLDDPQLTLHANGVEIAANDDWQNSGQSGQISSLNRQPSDAREPALLITLDPGAYTATVSGKNGAAGIGMVEVYALDDSATGSELINLSTRGMIAQADGVMIGGFVVQAGNSRRVLIKATAPSLSQAGISGVLDYPELALYKDGTQIAHNDDWASGAQAAEINSLVYRPNDARESAILATVTPGAYTAIVSSKNGGAGIGMVEMYVLE